MRTYLIYLKILDGQSYGSMDGGSHRTSSYRDGEPRPYHVSALIRVKIKAYDNNLKSFCRMLSNKPPTGNSLSHFPLL